MTLASTFGPLITIQFENLDLSGLAFESPVGASLPAVEQLWKVPAGAAFYPVYMGAFFNDTFLAAGSVTITLKTPSVVVPGSPSLRITVDDGYQASYLARSAGAGRIAAGSIFYPVLDATSDYSKDSATKVVILVSGYLRSE